MMMRVNHSCDPNVGMGGDVVLVSMRDIAAGEELTIDYALFLGDPGFAMECQCGAAACRGVVTGTDWMRPEVQRRYRGWFSWWLRREIARRQGGPVAERPARLNTWPVGPCAGSSAMNSARRAASAGSLSHSPAMPSGARRRRPSRGCGPGRGPVR